MADLSPRTSEEREIDSATLEYIRRRSVAREISERQKLAKDNEQSGWLGDAVKIGALGLAAYVLGKRVIADDYVLRGIHNTGQYAKRVVGQPVGKFWTGLKEEVLGAADVGLKEKSVEIVDDFTQAWHLVHQAEAQTGKQFVHGNSAHQQELFKLVRQGLNDRGYENLDRAGLSTLRVATVGDVMREVNLPRQQQSGHFKAMQRQLGSHNLEVIKKGIETGIMDKGMSLTRGHGGLFIDLTKATPGFIDTRFMKPMNIMRGAYNILSGVRVPFTGFRPVDLIANVLRPFGEGEFAGVIGSDLATTGKQKTSSALNFIIGGRQYAQRAGTASFGQVASNVKLNRMSGVGRARLERYGNLADKTAPALKGRIEDGTASLMDKVQYETGVGREYRSSESVIKRIWDTLRRRDAVVRGKAKIEPFEYTSREAALNAVPGSPGQQWAHKQRELARIQDKTHPEQVRRAKENIFATDFDVLGEAVENPPEMGTVEKVKVYAGMSRRGAVTRPKIEGLEQTVEERLVFPTTDAKIASPQGRRPAIKGLDPLRASDTGTRADNYKTATSPVEFYASQGTGATVKSRVEGAAEALVDVGYFMTSRLNDLVGWTTGLGFRPTQGRGILGGLGATAGNLAKLYGLNEAFHATLGYANYADYLFETTIGRVLPEGYDSPKKLSIRMYQGFQLARAYVRDAIGITGFAKKTEDLFPGMIDSGASWTARSALPAIAGGAMKGFKGAGIGLAASLLVGGNDMQTTAGEKFDEFTGDKDVAVRKNRWWMLGRQPFEGNQIDHFAPHWTRKALSDFRFTESQYGSKGEYYSAVSRLPTLHNMFGATMPFQEGGIVHGGDTHLAKKHRRTRPYPNTPGIDYEKAVRISQSLASKGPYDAPVGAGQRLGYGSLGHAVPVPEEGILGGIERFADKVSELGGIYKFLLSDLPGKDEPSFELANSRTIGSRSREYYDANLGGGFGMTELYRRFVVSQNARQGYNPVPNEMPNWMPGIRSRFQKDRTQPNRYDFTVGDPYARVTNGEYRLPGAGYESLHRLHSGSPGIYDAMDRFLILSDVAPTSEAFKHYKVIVDSWRSAGVLDNHWSGKFDVAKEQVKQKMERHQFSHRRFTGLITDPDPEGTAKRYNHLEKAAGGMWEVLTHDAVPAFGDVVPLLGPALAEKGMQQLSPVEHYKRYQVRGEEFADWRDPYKAFIRHKYYNVTSGDPISSAGAGAITGYMMGSNPISGALMGTVGAGIFLGGSAYRNTLGDDVPEFRKREYELKEWFDNFEYTKSRILEARSQAVGDPGLESFYRDAKRRTVAGLNFSERSTWSFTSQALKAMDRNNRAYFLHFLEMPEEAQQNVSSYMPRHLKPIMARATEQGDRIFSGYRKYARMSADSRVAGYFSQIGGMPKSDWAGWHPDVPTDAVKIKFIDSGVNSVAADIHKFDLFAEHRMRAAAFDNLPIPVGDMSAMEIDPSMSLDLQKQLSDAGFENVRFGYGTGPSYGFGWNIQQNTIDQLRGAIGEVLR